MRAQFALGISQVNFLYEITMGFVFKRLYN